MHTKGQANLFKLVGGPFVRGPHLITDMNVKRIMAIGAQRGGSAYNDHPSLGQN